LPSEGYNRKDAEGAKKTGEKPKNINGMQKNWLLISRLFNLPLNSK